MPEVISDTSPLQYLHQAKWLDLLHILYRTVLIPEGVGEEILEGRSLGYALPDLAGHLEAIKPVVDRLQELGFRLDSKTRSAVLELAEEA